MLWSTGHLFLIFLLLKNIDIIGALDMIFPWALQILLVTLLATSMKSRKSEREKYKREQDYNMAVWYYYMPVSKWISIVKSVGFRKISNLFLINNLHNVTFEKLAENIRRHVSSFLQEIKIYFETLETLKRGDRRVRIFSAHNNWWVTPEVSLPLPYQRSANVFLNFLRQGVKIMYYCKNMHSKSLKCAK